MLQWFSESETQERQGIQPVSLGGQEISLSAVELRVEKLFSVFGAPQKRVVHVLAANGVVEREIIPLVQSFVNKKSLKPYLVLSSKLPAGKLMVA